MEMRVGDLVMVTARVMNQKARKVIKADTSRMTAEVVGRERGDVISLLGRRKVEATDRRTQNTPEVSIKWLVVILSLVFITLTLITLEKAHAAATYRQRPTPRK